FAEARCLFPAKSTMNGKSYPIARIVWIISSQSFILDIVINVQIQKRECEAYNNGKWREVSPGRWEMQ
ncbi:MAG: hypothetical protein LBB83_03720, partial [Treponema sp.]|nr:hypothetical protein [Treponema sp.]